MVMICGFAALIVDVGTMFNAKADLQRAVDAAALALEDRDLVAAYDTPRAELGAYEASLLERTELVALNKIDLVADRSSLDPVEDELRRRGRAVFRVSGATGEGIEALLRAAAGALDAADAAGAA